MWRLSTSPRRLSLLLPARASFFAFGFQVLSDGAQACVSCSIAAHLTGCCRDGDAQLRHSHDQVIALGFVVDRVLLVQVCTSWGKYTITA